MPIPPQSLIDLEEYEALPVEIRAEVFAGLLIDFNVIESLLNV